VAVSTVVVVFMGVVVSMGEVSAVAVSTAVAFGAAVSAVALSTAVVFVVAVSAVAVSTAVAFVVAVSITGSLMTSSSAATVIRAGGAGAIRTDIMVTTITPTVTMAMDMVGTHTATTMDTADTVTTVAAVMDIAMEAERVTDTAMAADQGIPGVRGVGDIDPTQGAAKVVNAVSDCVRAELLRRIGFTDVLTPRNLAVELQSAA